MIDDPPLIDATDLQLAAAVEANVFAMFRAMSEALAGEHEERDTLSRFRCAPASPIFNAAYRTRLDVKEVDPAIDDTVAWFQARGAPFFFWWTGQDTRPEDLGERLVARGFSVFEKDAPAMAARLDDLDWDHPRPAGLRLAPIADDGELLEWKRIFLEAFGIPEFAGQAWVDATRTVGIGKTPWHLLLGRLESEAVCCGLMICGAGVAGLLGLGTLPAYRRRGIGSAMQLERLRIARDLGYRYAVLFASDMGHSAYRKLGFRDTGRTVSRYLWRESG